MLIYEKDNKLNISFENNMEETDIEIGKDEVKIGEATISENNVLPVPEEGDTGKVPTVQEDGSYALANAGGSSESFVVTFSGTTAGGDAACDKSLEEIAEAYNAGKVIFAKYHSISDHHGTVEETDSWLSNLTINDRGWLEGRYCYIGWNIDSPVILSVLECVITNDIGGGTVVTIVSHEQ